MCAQTFNLKSRASAQHVTDFKRTVVPNIQAKHAGGCRPDCLKLLNNRIFQKIQWTKPPIGEPSSSPRREGAGPPLYPGGGGGLVYGRRGDGGGLTGLGMGLP